MTSYAAAGAIAGAAGGLALHFGACSPRSSSCSWSPTRSSSRSASTLAGFRDVGCGRSNASDSSSGARSTRLGVQLAPARTPGGRVRRRARVGMDPVRARLRRARDGARLGSAARGAAVMAAFGLGTLPNLLAAGLAAERLRSVARPAARRDSRPALVVVLLGVVGLARIPLIEERPAGSGLTDPPAPVTASPEPHRVSDDERASSPTSRSPRPRAERGPAAASGIDDGVVGQRPSRRSGREAAACASRSAAPRRPPRGSPPVIRKSPASREICGAGAKDTDAPAAASVGASFTPSPTKRSHAPPLLPLAHPVELRRAGHPGADFVEAEAPAERARRARRVAGEQDEAPDPVLAQGRNDLLRLPDATPRRR